MIRGGAISPTADTLSIKVRLVRSPGARLCLSWAACDRRTITMRRLTPPACTPFSSKFQISRGSTRWLSRRAPRFWTKAAMRSGLPAEARLTARASDQIVRKSEWRFKNLSTQFLPTLNREGWSWAANKTSAADLIWAFDGAQFHSHSLPTYCDESLLLLKRQRRLVGVTFRAIQTAFITVSECAPRYSAFRRQSSDSGGGRRRDHYHDRIAVVRITI